MSTVKRRYASVLKKGGQRHEPITQRKQKGVSSYAKPKRKTLRELDKAFEYDDENELDQEAKEMELENEEKKGITDYIRNIFSK